MRLRVPHSRFIVVASVLAASAAIAHAQSGDAAPAVPPAPVAAPRLEIEQAEIHLGSIPRGETTLGQFTLRNAGDDVLRILHVKPG